VRQGSGILAKNTFTVSRRFFGFGTEDKQEYERLRNQYAHIVYTDRTHIADMAKIRGTITSFHEAAGERDPDTDNKSAWKLRVSRMPCSCLSCRGKITDPCRYMDVRQEQVHWVSERAATRIISRASTEFDANFKERLSDIFEGSNTVTKTMLQDRLRLLGKSEALSPNDSSPHSLVHVMERPPMTYHLQLTISQTKGSLTVARHMARR
jgi:hypothetical protein